MLAESLLIFSECILSAYPLLIKLVDASIPLQTGLRMFIYAGLAAIIGIATGSPITSLNMFSSESILTGLLNLLHVGTSYTAFDKLAAGNAMALFYTYPVWNILGAAAVFKEKVPLSSLPWIGLTLVGALLLAQPSGTNWNLLGVVAALLAAITETGIYLWFKNQKDANVQEPWTKMTQMYGSSGILWLIGILAFAAFGLLQKNTFAISSNGLASILLFNTCIGFVGYALRFYVIPSVSTITFSSLSFIGIVAAYALGWMFTNETPTIVQGLGALAIVIANTILLRREIV